MNYTKHLQKNTSRYEDFSRIANSLERIANALEHFSIEHAHIDEIDHNHVEGDVNTHAKTW